MAFSSVDRSCAAHAAGTSPEGEPPACMSENAALPQVSPTGVVKVRYFVSLLDGSLIQARAGALTEPTLSASALSASAPFPP